MGNHEYCVHCGESDFHYGYPCDPDKLAAKQKEEADLQARKKIAVENMVATLRKAGIPYQLDQYGNAQIRYWDFAK